MVMDIYRSIDSLGGTFDLNDERACGFDEALGKCLEVLDRAGVREGFPIERVIALVGRMSQCADPISDHFPKFSGACEAYTETREIYALIKPVDPDLLLARKLAAKTFSEPRNGNPYLDGLNDDFPLVRATLAGIKAGRALASEQAS